MIDEEKPLENKGSMTDTSEVSQQAESEPPSAGATLPDGLDIDAELSVNQESTNYASEAHAGESAFNQATEAVDLPNDTDVAMKELTQEIESVKAQLEERTNQYMRIAADFDNFRKRNQKEREDLEQQVKCSTIVELLPVIDNFERARSQIKPQTESEMNIHKSYQGVYKDLVERLKRIGVAPMRSEGKEFDPNLHEAVMREATDEYPEGTVMEELRRGYLLGERVLRHAMVKVAAAPEPVIISEEDQGNLET